MYFGQKGKKPFILVITKIVINNVNRITKIVIFLNFYFYLCPRQTFKKLYKRYAKTIQSTPRCARIE